MARMAQVRINKYLSMCGVTSRRGADALIGEQRIVINDVAITKLGTMIDPDTDVIMVDGVVVQPVSERIYIALNKPKMTLTTLHDPFKRRTVRHFLKELKQRVYPIGRLDYDVEGLLLLTNDGELAYGLAHPRFKVPKIYEARVAGKFTPDDARRIKEGLKLEDGAIGRAEVSILGFVTDQTRIRLLLTEGRKREVKQLCKLVGHPVNHLKRVEFAGLPLKNLKSGHWRHLTEDEVARIRHLVGLK